MSERVEIKLTLFTDPAGNPGMSIEGKRLKPAVNGMAEIQDLSVADNMILLTKALGLYVTVAQPPETQKVPQVQLARAAMN